MTEMAYKWAKKFPPWRREFCLFAQMPVHTVGKRQKTVTKMHIFHNDIRIVDTQIKVTEIPETADTKRNELIRKLLSSIFGDAEDSDQRSVLSAKHFEGFHGHDGEFSRRCALDQGIVVKNADQFAPPVLPCTPRMLPIISRSSFT